MVIRRIPALLNNLEIVASDEDECHCVMCEVFGEL